MRRRTPLTIALIVANVLGFVYQVSRVGTALIGGGGSLDRMVRAGALVPAMVTGQGQYWRIVTSGFLHGSVIHLAVNMYSLWVLGRFIEVIAGARRMAAIYAVSLVAAGLALVWLSDPFEVAVGASGAIFGLFGALFAIGLRLGRPGMNLVRANLGILVLNLIFSFMVPGIAGWAHVGGLIAGFLVTLVIFSPPPVVAAPPMQA
jgi:membrane associated rhomboid family serine protease